MGGGTEAYLQFAWDNSKLWNDLPNQIGQVAGYYVEYTNACPEVGGTIDYGKPLGTSSILVPEDKPGLQLVTFLDTNGNTVKIEWVEYGHDATPPAGYGTYADYTHVTSHRDLKPIAASVSSGSGYSVPNTAVK